MFELEPATKELARVVEGVRDDQLGAPTPCSESTVGDLLDHVDGLSLAFTAAATKTSLDPELQAPRHDASRLGPGWRDRIRQRLAALADAWRDDAAWRGMTQAGGVDLPADVMASVALNEVVVHGWDIAVATGQDFTCDSELLEAALLFVQPSVEQNPHGTPGMFGPPVPVPDDAPPLDRHLGLTGRDPAWQPKPPARSG